MLIDYAVALITLLIALMTYILLLDLHFPLWSRLHRDFGLAGPGEIAAPGQKNKNHENQGAGDHTYRCTVWAYFAAYENILHFDEI